MDKDIKNQIEEVSVLLTSLYAAISALSESLQSKDLKAPALKPIRIDRDFTLIKSTKRRD